MVEFDLMLRMTMALLAGGIVGLERTYRGRAAGLRTYALVALGSSALVAMAVWAGPWAEHGHGDPTRVVQGVVTGIGFLGAGVIVKDGLSVRGLTTAASIWVMAAIGMLFGAGLIAQAWVATAITWAALEVLRRLESKVPVSAVTHCEVAFGREGAPDREQLRALVAEHGFALDEAAYRLERESQVLCYELVLVSTRHGAIDRLARTFGADPKVVSFRLLTARD